MNIEIDLNTLTLEELKVVIGLAEKQQSEEKNVTEKVNYIPNAPKRTIVKHFKSGLNWSKQDIALFKLYLEQGKPFKTISKLLGRSTNALYNKRWEIENLGK